MLAEIIRKREEREQAHAEQLQREAEEGAGAYNRSDPVPESDHVPTRCVRVAPADH